MPSSTKYVTVPAGNYNRLEMWAWFLDPAKTTILDQELYWRLQQLDPLKPMRRPGIRLLPLEVATLLGWLDHIPKCVRDNSDVTYAQALENFIDPDSISA